MEQLGLGRHPPDSKMNYRWGYASLANPPVISGEQPWAASIYRGLVPAKNISNRDFAVNGAMVFFSVEREECRRLPLWHLPHSREQFSAHHAYVCEVSAHWISAYFRRDALRLPQSVDEAIEAAEQDGAWVRRRYPHTLNWVDESNTSAIAFWT
jgi:dimethylaniline monooxygenase (N-oxide forming)